MFRRLSMMRSSPQYRMSFSRTPLLRRRQLPRRRLTTPSNINNNNTSEALATQVEKELLGGGAMTSSSSQALTAWTASLSPLQRQTLQRRLWPSETDDDVVPEPSYLDLRLVAINNAIPFVGFGIMDNAILIIAGDAIDTSLGVMLGISTLCAAAIGNIISDVAGILLGTVIEDLAAQLNLPVPQLTAAQRQLRSVRFANQLGCAIGIVVGCIIGMFPLLYIDTQKVQERKREAHLDAIFGDVVNEAGSLVGAAKMSLYIRVNPQKDNAKNNKNNRNSSTPIPSVDGKYLYARYDESKSHNEGRLAPLGRGIVSRAALTGEAWKIDDVRAEPDWDQSITHDAETMICVPVLDGNGQTIAVLQAINKIGKGQLGDQDEEQDDRLLWMVRNENDPNATAAPGTTSSSQKPKPRPFTGQDVQILKALASHIGVSLRRLYETKGEEEELRLRDTIQVLKQYGLEGLSSNEKTEVPSLSPISSRRNIPLFPEE